METSLSHLNRSPSDGSSHTFFGPEQFLFRTMHSWYVLVAASTVAWSFGPVGTSGRSSLRRWAYNGVLHETGVTSEDCLWFDKEKTSVDEVWDFYDERSLNFEELNARFSDWTRKNLQLTETRPIHHLEEEYQKGIDTKVTLNDEYKWTRRHQWTGPFVVLEEPKYNEKGDFYEKTFAVFDTRNPRRIFLGFNVQKTFTDYNLVGAIAYFDDNGMCTSISVFDEPLFTFDSRNGVPSPKSVFLVKDTVVFIWQHRDVRQDFRIDGWVLDDDDTLNGRCKINLKKDVNQNDLEFHLDSSGRWLTFLQNYWNTMNDDTLAIAIDIPSIRRGVDAKCRYNCDANAYAFFDKVSMPAKELLPFKDHKVDMSPALQQLHLPEHVR